MKQVVINLNTSLDQLGLVYGEDWMQLAMIHDEIQLACLPEHKDLIMTTWFGIRRRLDATCYDS